MRKTFTNIKFKDPTTQTFKELAGFSGQAGISPQLRKTSTAIEVSYDNGSTWQTLVLLSEITGPRGEQGQIAVDTEFDDLSMNPIANSTLTEAFTAMTQAEYDALITKSAPLYFIYEEE